MLALEQPPSADRTPERSAVVTREVRVVLLGHGRIGAEVARLLHGATDRGATVRVAGALVRSRTGREAVLPFPLHHDPAQLLHRTRPHVVVEVLGGLEPARTLVLEALAHGVPVVTANKSLVAAHGDELYAAAARAGVALRCEAAVVAGVPFLETFSARPLAASAERITAIANGTSNFILSRIDGGVSFGAALDEARQLGYAESDPSKDIDGTDAAEKLAILIRRLWGWTARPAAIPRIGIDGLHPEELKRARELGGRIKPVVHARRSAGTLHAFTGPAFLSESDPLSRVDGVLNGVRLARPGELPIVLTGPGAGPAVTARTVVDDVLEILAGSRAGITSARGEIAPEPPDGVGFYVSLRGHNLPAAIALADLLAAHGVWARRWADDLSEGGRSLLTFPCRRAALEASLRALRAAVRCDVAVLPVIEDRDE